MAAGTMPWPMIAETVALASSTLPKTPSSVFTASGTGTRRTVTFVAMPSVPSEPTKMPVRS